MALTFAAVVNGNPVGMMKDPGDCAVQIATEVDDVTNIAAATIGAVTDCKPGPDGKVDALTCASDITDLTDQWFGLSKDTIETADTCGSAGTPACVTDILATIIGALDTSVGMMGAASSCVSDPFSCTVTVMDSVDTMNDMTDGVVGAMESCKPEVVKKSKYPAWWIKFTDWLAGPPGHHGGHGGYYERRLEAAPRHSESLGDATHRFEELRERLNKLKADHGLLQNLTNVLNKAEGVINNLPSVLKKPPARHAADHDLHV